MKTLDYNGALSYFNQMLDSEAEIVHDSGASILQEHGYKTPRAYVLLHGATSSPFQWLEFARILFDLGHNVFIPRAPYHGLRSRQVSEMAQLRAEDLHVYAAELVDTGLALGDEVVLAGISGGGTIAAWAAVQRTEIGRTLLAMPFLGLYGLPAGLSPLLMKACGRLPDMTLAKPSEPIRPWVYRGQSSRGIGAYLSLAIDVLQGAQDGFVPKGEIIIFTTATDRQVNNETTDHLAGLWREAGAQVVQYAFPREMAFPHNPADPAADAFKRELFYEKILDLLGER